MAVTAVHHVTLRVQDPEATRSFFTSLGLDTTDIPAPSDVTRTWRGAPETGGFIAIPVGATFVVIAPPLDGAASDDRFDERRIGVDHLAIGVDSRSDLERLVTKLAALGVPNAGIELDPVLGHEYVCFRDPDNVQWEFYQG